MFYVCKFCKYLVFCVINLIETKISISTLYYFAYISTSQWVINLKGSVYRLFYILACLKLLFLACLDATYISCYIFFKRLNFEVFKTEKTTLKNLNEEKYRQSENGEFEAVERVIILLS